MQCAESLRVQAYFDGELDALSAAEIERHGDACAECRALLADLDHVRSALRRDLSYACAPPPALRTRVLRALDQESPRKSTRLGGMRLTSRRSWPFWMGAFSGIGASSIAAGIAFFVMASPLTNPVLDEVVSAHVRSLMPDHLIDVVSTDKHTVKPWFAGHTDVSPVVADFSQQGYRLVGGRADYFDHQRSAVVVFQHGSHVINVFSWAADQRGLPKNTTRNGYHLAFWKTGNLVYCAVSDTAWDELLGLTRLLQDSSASDAR
ncbi:MAG: anti-sigma factor [Steroidobacteraceae bacterium]